MECQAKLTYCTLKLSAIRINQIIGNKAELISGTINNEDNYSRESKSTAITGWFDQLHLALRSVQLIKLSNIKA